MCAAAAAIAVLAIRARRPTTPELRELIAAVGKEPTRPVEGRLAGFAYAPVASQRRGPAAVSVDVRLAAAKVEKAGEAETRGTAAALGIAYLVTGELDKAIATLERASMLEPTAAAQSDLSAAYLERAARDDRHDDLASAIAAAERALHLSHELPEALFNRALALEKLGLSANAIDAWRRSLQRPIAGDWELESRRHLQTLQSHASGPVETAVSFAARVQRAQGSDAFGALASGFPVRAREFVEDDCGLVWAESMRSPDAAVPDLFSRCGVLARRLFDITRDRLAMDLVQRLERATAEGDALRGFAVAGHRAFHAAQGLYLQDKIAASEPLYREAATALERAGDPLALVARYHVALCRSNAGDVAAAASIYDALRTETADRGYRSLYGLVLWKIGLASASRGAFGDSLQLYRESLGVFESVGESEHIANLHSLLAEDYRFLGDVRLAWDEHAKALAHLRDTDSYRIRHQILVQGALTSLRQGLPEVAIHFQNAALTNAVSWTDAAALTTAYLHRARAFHDLGRNSEAAADLREARAAQQRIPDAEFAGRYDLEIVIAEGNVWRSTDPRRAVERLESGEQRIRAYGATVRLPELLLARSRARAGVGDLPGAEADLRAGIELFEAHRRQVGDDSFRISFLDGTWELFGDLAGLEVAAKRPDLALAVIERSRSRALLDRLDGDRQPVNPGAIAAALPEETAIVYFALLPDRVAIWTLTRAGIGFVESKSTPAVVAREVRAFREACERNVSIGLHPIARSLYARLLAPVDPVLRSHARLVIVPDGVLSTLPFAALEDERGVRVIERNSIEIAPSLAVLAAGARPGPGPAPMPRTLVVGNPQSGAPNLIEAEAEARAVAREYADSVTLIGDEATKDRVLAEIDHVTVAHFSTHAISNTEFPGLSRILLTTSKSDGGAWYASEIGRRTFRSLQLVVLAACGTADGATARGEGVLSLARSFLAAGVPSVVATLWSVDDHSTRLLFETFHRRLREHASTTDALRDAQLTLLKSDDPLLARPAAWAGVVSIGAAAGPEGRPHVRSDRSTHED